MKILIKDVLQQAGTTIFYGSSDVLTPALKDTSTSLHYAFFFTAATVNCVCFGNFAASGAVTVTLKLYNLAGLVATLTKTYGYVVGSTPYNTIWYLGTDYAAITSIDITFDSDLDYIGRIAAGQYRDLPIYKPREPGLICTTENRKTLGGQIVEGAGGVTQTVVNVEIKNKIDANILIDVMSMKDVISKKFPFFIDFTDDRVWLGNSFGSTAFYAIDSNNILFQSSINSVSYSKKFTFEEVF